MNDYVKDSDQEKRYFPEGEKHEEVLKSMGNRDFVWDEAKNRHNLQVHHVNFETAMFVFNDINRIEIYDESHTGRDSLWNQAITKFFRSPIIGNGILTQYTLSTGVIADHAHSHYLDLLAKYGIVILLCFIFTVSGVIHKVVHSKNKKPKLISLNCVVLGTFLLHSIVDHLELFNFILVLTSIEILPMSDYKNYFLHPKILKDKKFPEERTKLV